MKTCLVYAGLNDYYSRQKLYEYLGNSIDKEYIITDYLKSERKKKKCNYEYIELSTGRRKKPLFMYDVHKTIKKISSEDIDIIHDYFYNSIISNILQARTKNLPHKHPKIIISTVTRNMGWFKEIYKIEPYNSPYYLYLRSLNYLFESISYKFADGIMVNSMDIAKDLINYYKVNPDIIKVIPNSVDTDYFYPHNITKEELNLNPRDNILLFVGNVFRHKGIYDILKSLPTILNKEPNTRLLIIGTVVRNEKNKLEELIDLLDIRHNVTFLGKISQDLLINYYSVADALIFPSLYEGSPRSVQEAIACGCPVIATDISGITMLDEEKKFISFVKIKNPEQIADNVINLIKDPNLRKELSKKGISHINKEFSHENVSKQIIDFYKIIIE